MAVVIPRLQQITPAGPQQSDRIQAEAPNLLGATEPMRKGLGSAISTVSDAYTDIQNDLRKKELAVKDLKATEKAIGYEQALKARLDIAKQQKGDPTPYYKQFDEDMVKLESALYDDDLDPETQILLKEKVIKANGRILDTRSTNYTGQYYGWQKEVADSSVKLRQDNAVKDSAYLDATNPISFGKVQASLDEIQGTRTAIAIQNGYDIRQVKDEKTGVVTWDYSNAPAIEAQIKADIGDTIIPMVKTLNGAGKVTEAKAIIESQKKWLNADDIAKLTAENDEASVKNRALDALSKLGPNPSIDQINNLKGIGEDVKFKMQELNHTRSLHRQRETKMKVDTVMNQMYQDIQAVNNSKTPYVSVEDFKNRSNLWKNNKDMLSVENMKTIEKLVTTVEETDPKAFNEAMALVQSGELSTIGGQRLLDLRSKIEDRVWNKVFDTYFRGNVPDSESRKQANIAFASKEITGYFTKQVDQYGNPTFPKNKKGQYTNANDEQLVSQSQQQLADWIASNPSVTTKEIQEKTKELYNDAIRAKEEATPQWIKNIRSFMDSFRSQNPLLGGKRPSLSTDNTQNPAAVKITQDQVNNTPPANATQQAQTVPGSQQTAPQNGGNMAKWTPAQWMSAFDSDPANRDKSFANPAAKRDAVKKYAREKLGK